MKCFGVRIKKSATVDETYRGLRERAVNITPSDINISLNDEHKNQVYAAIVDMPIGEKIVTLVCFFDGTTSLYFSNGGGILGGGRKHEIIQKAAGDFLFSSGQAIPFMQKASDYPLPTSKNSMVYLKCGEGTYTTQFNMAESQNEKYKAFLNFLIQRVINAFRESHEL